MQFDKEFNRRVISAIAQSIIDHADELTELDRAIGDADHGINMKNGFAAVLGDLDALAAKPLPEMLKGVGTQLVMTIGGASGPLYGTLFLALGRSLPEHPTYADLVSAGRAAFAAVKARGKSDVGQKTMIDVLAPVLAVLESGGDDLPKRLARTAAMAAAATVPVRATRGRASFLGERSIGHVDPGASSASMMVAALCDVLGGS